MDSSSNRQAENRRKKKMEQNSLVSIKRGAANILKSGQNTRHTTKKVNDSRKIYPSAEKEVRLEKKEAVLESCQKYKPVFDINTPEDYSANWKRLKEIITKHDKAKVVNKVKRISGKISKHQSLKVMKNNTNRDQNKEENMTTGKPNSRQGNKASHPQSHGTAPSLKEEGEFKKGITDAVAMDCEMVGVGFKAKESMLARVSLVNQYGHKLYDKFVKPMEKVVDYRTSVSGVRPYDMQHGEDFFTVQQEVAELIKGKLLVGHAIHNDLRVLYLSHPKSHIRDTSRYGEFKKLFHGFTPGLKKLAEKVLGIKIQEGEHSPVQDAQATMSLYMSRRKEWEMKRKNVRAKRIGGAKKKKKAPAKAPREIQKQEEK